ncbi:uncharacterized protein VP01_3189g1, partial [Puccinia sorghi]
DMLLTQKPEYQFITSCVKILPTNISNISLCSSIQDDHLRLAIKITIILILIASIYKLSKITCNPYNDAKFTGACYTNFLLNGNSSTLAKINENPVSTCLSMQDQLAIFMYIVGQRPILRVFHHIIYLLLKLALTYIKIVKPGLTHAAIYDNPKSNPFFNDCLGAFNGVHVLARVPEYMAAPWLNRKGTESQKVGVFDFDMLFTCIYIGWEGWHMIPAGSYLKHKWRTSKFQTDFFILPIPSTPLQRVCLCHTVASVITYANRGWLRKRQKIKKNYSIYAGLTRIVKFK